MAKRIVWSWSAVAASVCCIGAWAMSDDKAKQEAPAADPPDAAMMEAWNKAMTPGEHHKKLEMMAGNFTYRMWMKMDPAQPPIESEGEYTGEMIMGGRYLDTISRGNMMGMPFEGRGCFGFDNVLNKHVATWIDNMGTGIMRSEGTCDETGNVITFEGEMIDPMTNKAMQYKYVYTIKSDDEFTMQWWSPNLVTGEMFESMGITSTRVK